MLAVTDLGGGEERGGPRQIPIERGPWGIILESTDEPTYDTGLLGKCGGNGAGYE